MDPHIDKHEKIEELMADDLENWLCNLYFEIVKLPRQGMLQFKESVTGFFCTVQGGSNLTFNLSMDKTLWSDHENEEVKLYCKRCL